MVRVSHWLGNGLVVCLYGLGQSSPLELGFGLELGLGVISLHAERTSTHWHRFDTKLSMVRLSFKQI